MMTKNDDTTAVVRGVVSRVGDEPMLKVEGKGEFRFAYRNVKKRPNEEKPLLALGDILECKLSTGPCPRPLALRLVKGGTSGPASLAKQSSAPLHAGKKPKTKKSKSRKPSTGTAAEADAAVVGVCAASLISSGDAAVAPSRVSGCAILAPIAVEDKSPSGSGSATCRSSPSPDSAALDGVDALALSTGIATSIEDASFSCSGVDSCSRSFERLEIGSAFIHDPYNAVSPRCLVQTEGATRALSCASMAGLASPALCAAVEPMHAEPVLPAPARS
eukprot:TRINITY_DN503_c0_g1_i1.p1 TRINITY_DN503_c0_g1~~TRINITY_DN503_c0_g1_i1.p1  ORF type:complete len:275 (+),score=42.94 TRINITY_DN503_c0_g1_i1:55-879(+)